MLMALAHSFGAWISAPRCLRCGAEGLSLCLDCTRALGLDPEAWQGLSPLPWCSLGAYGGALRGLLLGQRRRLQVDLVRALAQLLGGCHREQLAGRVLVPIPSWKRAGNPLPPLIASGLAAAGGSSCQLAAGLLRRRRPALGQHHLRAEQRLANLEQAFSGLAPAGGHRLWLVDDILTTGATALSAAQALERAGHRVEGLFALARTPLAAPAVI